MDTRFIIYAIIFFSYFLFGRNNRKGFIILVCTILCAEAGLRHVYVGTDTYRYYYSFQEAQNMLWSDILMEFKYSFIDGTSKDPGYLIVEKTFHYISDDWQLYLFTLAAFFFICLGRFIYQNTESPLQVLFAFVLYMALFHMVILCVFRQAICMAISFLLFPYLVKKKWIFYIVLTLLASTIHRSMLLILFMIPLSMLPMEQKKRGLMLSFLSVPLVAIFARPIIAYMASTIKNEYYSQYAESQGFGGAVFYFLMCAMVALYIFINIKYFESRKRSIYVAGIILLTAFAPLIIVHGALIRISQYFAFYMMFAIPIALDKRQNSQKAAYTIVILLLLALSMRAKFVYFFFWEYVPFDLLLENM